MKRKAFLIESSRLQSHPDLPGARVDVLNWKNFLLSDEGGAWEEKEIVTLSNPTRIMLQGLLALEASTDYVFITFSGHGFHIKGKDLDESMICLNTTENVAVSAVNPGNPRCMLIIDACRQLVQEDVLIEMSAANLILLSAASPNRVAYRNIFDIAVTQAERGVIRLFSCDIDEAANESPHSGGFYTNALVECCRYWHDNIAANKKLYYPAWDAHQSAAIHTTLRNAQQHPQYSGGRRNKYFPLVVKP